MRFKSLLIILFLTSLVCPREPDFIDFTYTQLLEETRYTGSSKEKIVIQPDTRHLEKYQFPQVCELQDSLFEGTESSGTVDHLVSIDDYLSTLKEEILNLLKLAETIKNVRSYLAQIGKHLELREQTPVTQKFKSELESLSQKQSQLSVSKQNIQSLTTQLNHKINEYNRNPRNEQFKTISLNYDIQNYNTKIDYLKDLKEKSISQASAQPHTNFTDFFNKLGFDLRDETQQIQFIDRYFQNVTHLNYLKDTAHSIRDNIEVDRLNIEYKKTCEKEKQDIITKSSSHAEIKATLQHLREKKKQFGNITNKYCEGVALKLENQIKRLLKAINWTFTCADDLEEFIRKRQHQITILQNIEDQINKYGAQGFDNYQKQYQNTKNHIQSKFNQIKNFTIDQYNHDPVYLDELIAEANRKRAQAQHKLKHLPQEMSSDTTFNDIKRLAEDIKREKAKFCHEYGLYDVQQRRLWFLVYREEQNRVYAAKMREEYINEGRKLQSLENQYRERSQKVIKELVDNYVQQ